MPDFLLPAFAGLGAGGVAILAAGLFVAAFSRGYSGFGFSALLVMSWSLVVRPSVAVAMAIMMEISASLMQARQAWRAIDWRIAAPLLAAAMFGNPVGIAILRYVPADLLRLGIAALALAASLTMLRGTRLPTASGRAGSAAVGFASGVINGSTAMGGLPVALFFAARGLAPVVMRATFIAYFFLLDAAAATLLAAQGLIGLDLVAALALALPVLGLGVWLGSRHFLGATPEAFRRNMLWLMVALSLAGLVRALWPLVTAR